MKSAAEIASLVRARRISPVEIVQDHLRRIEALNPTLNAFVYVNAEQAVRDARVAEHAAMRGSKLPLLGVPVSIKSCIEVAGLPCPAGSRLRSDVVANADAALVTRLKQAGAIVIGLTNTPEMLMAYETDNALHGRTYNPWELARTAGGSSGGEAAAIAAALSAAGIGSDAGGSVRVPAHFCGICALKPTPGRIPGTGHFPSCVGPFAQLGVVGPMARTIADLQLVLDAVAGPDFGDPMAAAFRIAPVTQENARRMRVGFFAGDSDVISETRAAVKAAARALADRGFHVEPFRPAGLEEAQELWRVIFCLAGAMLVRAAVAGRESEVSPTLQKLLDYAASQPPLTADRLLNTLIARDQLRARFLAQMGEPDLEQCHPGRARRSIATAGESKGAYPARTLSTEKSFPILLLPVGTAPAFRHGEGGWDDRSPANYLRTMRYSQVWNLLGLPAAVVPVARSAEGLPLGVQIVGRPYEEEAVLAVAAAVEEQFGYLEPPVVARGESSDVACSSPDL